MIRRTALIALGFACVLTVIILGNFIHNWVTDGEYKDYDMKEVSWYSDESLKDKKLGILVEIDTKLLYLIDQDTNTVIKKYVVATGARETPTPIGSFKIVQKGMWGEGFGTRWMGINVPWGKYGIHGTDKPNSIGYNSSHGCIRMRNKDAEELYRLVKYNTPVMIVGGPFGPLNHGYRTLAPGDRGADVQEVQKRLKMKGYYHGSIDGIYGDGMKAALLKFLKDNNMPITDRIGHNIYKKLDIILME